MTRPHVLTLPLILAALPLHAGEHRHHGAHVHGVTQMQLALDGTALEISLTAPGMDIVGFEHPAGDAAETEAVTTALALLGDSSQILVPNAEAECQSLRAEAELEIELEDGHSAFHAHYAFTCARPEALSSIALPYFSRFPQAMEIEAEFVTGAVAGSAEIPRDAAALRLE